MPANLYIYFRGDDDDNRDREDFAEALEDFFGDAAEDCGAGSGSGGFNLDYELADGEDPDLWSDRLRAFLEGLRVPRGTAFTTFPEDWETGDEWRCVCVYGEDVRRSDDPVTAVPGITRRCP